MALTLDLARRALGGDETAVRALVRALTPIIQAKAARALLRRRAGSGGRDVRQEIDDLTQNVLLHLFKNNGEVLHAWEPERSPLTSFVALIAEREIASTLRTISKNPWTEYPTEEGDLERPSSPSHNPEEVTGSRELLQEITSTALSKLSEQGRELFYLLMIEARSVEDVCFVMNMKPDAVYAWRSRIRRLVMQIADQLLSEK